MLATYVTWIMQKYLSDVWKIGFTHAAGIMNVYNGLAKCVPLFLFSFVDCGVDNFWILLFSSIAFSTVRSSAGKFFISSSSLPLIQRKYLVCNVLLDY